MLLEKRSADVSSFQGNYEEGFSSRRINMLSTADFVLAFGLHGVLLCLILEIRLGYIYIYIYIYIRCFEEYERGLVSVRIFLSVFSLARPCPAAPPYAPTRRARKVSGFEIRQVYIGFRLFVLLIVRSSDVFSMP